jgi:hypothetical protein
VAYSAMICFLTSVLNGIGRHFSFW